MADVKLDTSKYPDNDNKSDVVQIANELRSQMLAQNVYTSKKLYDASNPNAISDGDEKGRERSDSNSIGTSIDIQRRNAELARNKYTNKRFYKIDE